MSSDMSAERGPRIDFYANQLKRLRKQSGLTQLDLCIRAGLTPSTLSRLENGHQTPTLVTAEALAAALQVPLGVLLDGPVTPRPPRENGDR
jgi:transcriptional regulator with XRE-family HTH domain